MTASSDIPVGLEPLLYPWDFVWPNHQAFEHAKTHLQKFQIQSLALMDGGIIDNQGVEGVMLATATENRAKKVAPGTDLNPQTAKIDPTAWNWGPESVHEDLDLALFIISDVPLLSNDIYDPDWKRAPATTLEEKLRYTSGELTFGGLHKVLWLLFILSAATGVTVVSHAVLTGQSLGGLTEDLHMLLLYGLPLALVATVGGSLFWLWLQSRRVFESISSKVPGVWPHLKRLTLNEVVHMLALRLSSTWALTSTIFLNRIRRLMYNLVYTLGLTAADHEIGPTVTIDEHPPSGKNFFKQSKTPPLHFRIVPCEIYALANEPPGLPDWLQPTDQIRELAKRASGMETTLWLSQSQLDDLVACGQLTACFSMLQHFLKLPTWPAPQPYTPYFKQAQEDWKTLQKNPYAFVPGRGQDKAASAASGASAS